VQEKNGILDHGGVSLFHFTVNPKSFGQTVENLFYVSFLVKNGLVGIEFDSDGIPSLRKLVNFVYICRHSQLTFDSGNKCQERRAGC
jgi:Nse4 C-terminal